MRQEQSLMLSSVERIAAMMDADDLDAAPVLLVGQIQEEPPQSSEQ